MEYSIERFTASDGDSWFSIVSSRTDDIATGVMHATHEDALRELLDFDADNEK
jgi:hypothetical protein